MRILFLTDRCFQGDRFLSDLEDLPNFLYRNIHADRDFFRGRLSAELLNETARSPDQLVNRFDHVNRDTDRSGLVSDCSGNGLTDPPGGVSRELVAPAILEFVNRLHEANVALLDQVKKLKTTVSVFLGN